MRTPAGVECPYFYGDYYRGREREECRLLAASIPPLKWTADLCKTCPVPGITRANACENLLLKPKIIRPFSAAFTRRVQITASCKKSGRDVPEPHIGCGECHTLPTIFKINDL